MIGGFRSVWCVSVLQGLLLVIAIMIDGSEKRNCEGEPQKMNVKFHRNTSYTWNFQNFTCVITILVIFEIHFLGLPCEFFFGVTTDDLLHLELLKNVKKKYAIFFKLFWYRVFVYWKLKLLNFLVDSVLILQLLDWR